MPNRDRQEIFKYPFPIRSEFTIEMPDIHDLVLVAPQNGVPIMWMKVGTRDGEYVFRSCGFSVVGTGRPLPEGSTWLGSFMDGAFVWHLLSLSGIQHLQDAHEGRQPDGEAARS